jgi:hypothetical protein
MENRHIARYFIETLTGEKLVDVATMPQEYTYRTRVKDEKQNKEDDKKKEYDILSVIRYDFVATIRNADGETKKVLIEIQKSNKPAHLLRFRSYLGEQYRKTDVMEVATGKVEKALPIICIYLLGFKLPDIKSSALKVGRVYIDMIGKKEIKGKNKWIESLTHDGYFVQIPRINGKPRTSLEKLLSVFEQKYFIDDKETVKDYEYTIDDENIKKMIEVLRHAAADKRTRREMEEAWFSELAEREYEELEKELVEVKKTIEENKKIIEEDKKTIEENKKTIEDSKKTIEEKDKSLADKDRENEKLKNELEKLKRHLENK